MHTVRFHHYKYLRIAMVFLVLFSQYFGHDSRTLLSEDPERSVSLFVLGARDRRRSDMYRALLLCIVCHPNLMAHYRDTMLSCPTLKEGQTTVKSPTLASTHNCGRVGLLT